MRWKTAGLTRAFETFFATDPTGRHVVAKSVPADGCLENRAGRVALLEREYEILLHLSQTPLVEEGLVPEPIALLTGPPTLVMNRLEGIPLSMWKGTAADRQRVLIKLESLVDRLHRVGVVHRDIKPSNVLVSTDGAVALVDFGSACYRDSPSSMVGPWTEVEAGTPPYASPSLRQDPVTATGTDVDSFSLRVLYEGAVARLESECGSV